MKQTKQWEDSDTKRLITRKNILLDMSLYHVALVYFFGIIFYNSIDGWVSVAAGLVCLVCVSLAYNAVQKIQVKDMSQIEIKEIAIDVTKSISMQENIVVLNLGGEFFVFDEEFLGQVMDLIESTSLSPSAHQTKTEVADNAQSGTGYASAPTIAKSDKADSTTDLLKMQSNAHIGSGMLGGSALMIKAD
ncbi:hypothetical protein [uncultured Helicobacter sp.]|uniref:hypothetical protein n=1 Tax=uncultured Helicobacter sp. TaxID=175537 RepID=UPI00374E82B2